MFKRFKPNNTNQTEFASQAPFLTEPSLADIDPVLAQSQAVKRARLKKLLFMFGLGFVMLAGVLLVFSLFLTSRSSVTEAPTPTPTSSPTTTEDDSLLGQLESLKTELKLSDPAEDELFFPNVDQSIYLDKPKNP